MAFFTEFISSFNTINTAVGGAFEVGFHECPTIDAGVTNYGQCTGGGCLFLGNNGDKWKEQGAWEFMKFLLSDENQIEKHKVSGYLPFSYTAVNNEALKDLEGGMNWPVIMAGNCILVAPILIAFLFFAKKIIAAMAYRGVK